MKKIMHAVVGLILFVLPVNAQGGPRYRQLLQDLKLNLEPSFKSDKDLKKREKFKNDLVQITSLLTKPEDLAAYLKELVVNFETIIRLGRTEESKRIIQETVEGAQELLMSITQNYKYPTGDVASIKNVTDVMYRALNLLNGVDVGEDKIQKAKDEQDAAERNYNTKMEDLFIPMRANQLISFSDKITTQKFIKHAKAFIAELKNLSADSTVYLKRFVADLEGVMNTGFSARTQDVVLKGITRLKKSIDNAYNSVEQDNKWHYELVTLLSTVIVRLDNDYRAKKLEEEKKQSRNDTRSPQEVYNNQSKKSDWPSAEIAAHAALVKAHDVQSYKKFFGDINVAIPMECNIDENKGFAEQLPIIWPCKMKYVDALVKKYHTALHAEFKQLDSLALQLVLFIKNKSRMSDADRKAKLDDLKNFIVPFKDPKKSSFLSKIKSLLPGNKKKVEEIIAELKKAIVLDIERYLLEG